MRPFVSQREAFITHVLPVGDRLAVLSGDGIDWLDATLQSTGRTSLPEGGRLVSSLGDGRLLQHSSGFGSLHVGTEHGPWERVRIGGEDYASGSLPTLDGFVAWTQRHLLVDQRGERRELALDLVLLGGVTCWGPRVVLTTPDALLVLADGAVQRHPLRSKGAPVAVGQRLFVPSDDGEVLVLDESLAELDRFEGTRVFPWGRQVVTFSKDEVLIIDPADPDAASVFDVPNPGEALACGDFLAVGSWEVAAVWLCHRPTNRLTKEPLPGPLRHAARLGEGVVCIDTVGSAATWWAGEGTCASLPHDFTPRLLVEVPGGVATTDDDVLYVWRPGEDGPALQTPAEGPPLGERVVVAGSPVVLEKRGHFASRGLSSGGAAVRVANDAEWRPACDAATAKALVDRLLARDVEGAVPGQPLASTAFLLSQRPVGESYALQARALFAPDGLSEHERFAADTTRATWLGELGAALGVSARGLFAAVQARQFPLKAPKEVPGFEYVGAFSTDGSLVVSDPCHLGKKSPAGPFSLNHRVEVRAGTWHAWLRPGSGEFADRTAELLVAHADGLGVAANVPAGQVGVDAGFVGVFDAKCPKPEGHYDEGVFRGKAAMASSGVGDGFYPVFTGSAHGHVVKVRAWFLGPGAAELDASVAKAGSRRYSPRERFEVGETLEHPTFGVGTVARERDGKMEVLFGEALRVLVHRRG